MISVQVRNVERIKQKLEKLPIKIRGIATTEASRYLIGNEQRGLQHYPAPPSSSMYRRTYKLRFGWQVSGWNDGTKVKVENKVPYAKYVQGTNTQAWMHRDRWRTVSQVVSDNIRGAMKAIDQAVARYIRGQGLGR